MNQSFSENWEAVKMDTGMKDVMIRVTSLQRDENGHDEKISLETPGKFGVKNNVSYIMYKETELTGMQGTTTALKFYSDHACLVRMGSFMQRQEYRPGEVIQSKYDTPLGSIDMSLHTREIVNRINGGNGQAKISYDIEMSGLFLHFNELVIDVWEEPVSGSKGTAEKSN